MKPSSKCAIWSILFAAILVGGCTRYKAEDLQAAEQYAEVCREYSGHLEVIARFYETDPSWAQGYSEKRAPGESGPQLREIQRRYEQATEEYLEYRHRLPPKVSEDINKLHKDLRRAMYRIPSVV